MRFSWNIAAVASALTALILLFPLPGSIDCAGPEGEITSCKAFYESTLVRYDVSYLAAAGIALGIAIFIGATIHIIGRSISDSSKD